MNKVVLLGRLAADPELRQTPNGITVTSLTANIQKAPTVRPTGLTLLPGGTPRSSSASISRKARPSL